MANRIFIATKLLEPLAAPLQAIQDKWHRQMPSTYVRWVKADCLHLTFHFLGDITTNQINLLPELLTEALSGLAPQQVLLNGLGAFPTVQRASVLMCKVEDAPGRLLEQIYNRLAVMLTQQGIRIEQRTWRPHLTLGRLPIPAPVDISWYQQEALAWVVNSVSLMSSVLGPGGPLYHTLHVVPLGN